MTELPKPQGITQSGRQEYRPLLANPVTNQISHTKFWANIAAATMTCKFAMTPDAPEWLWIAYGSMVGGYALSKRGIAAIPQLAQIKRRDNEHGQ